MAYTPTNWVEGVTTLGPTNMNKIESELAFLDARIPVAVLGYGTTLPGSPVDGQEAILVDSTTNPTYTWRFRYNAGSSSAYKWEFVGGTPAVNEQTANAGIGGASYAAISPLCLIALPRAGEYVVSHHAGGIHDSAGALTRVSVQFGAAGVVDADGWLISETTVNYHFSGNAGPFVRTATSSMNVQMMGMTSAGTATVYNRQLSVTPKRVA